MTNSTSQKPSILFWIISIIALVWYAMGVKQYLDQAYQTDAFKAMYPDSRTLEMVTNAPSWVTASFAIAVFIGLLGCIALLLRKKWASILLLVSLIAAIAQAIYNIFVSKAIEVYGPGAIIMPIIVILFGLFLYFYSKKMSSKGILN